MEMTPRSGTRGSIIGGKLVNRNKTAISANGLIAFPIKHFLRTSKALVICIVSRKGTFSGQLYFNDQTKETSSEYLGTGVTVNELWRLTRGVRQQHQRHHQNRWILMRIWFAQQVYSVDAYSRESGVCVNDGTCFKYRCGRPHCLVLTCHQAR